LRACIRKARDRDDWPRDIVSHLLRPNANARRRDVFAMLM
jgi:hypothetical protein